MAKKKKTILERMERLEQIARQLGFEIDDDVEPLQSLGPPVKTGNRTAPAAELKTEPVNPAPLPLFAMGGQGGDVPRDVPSKGLHEVKPLGLGEVQGVQRKASETRDYKPWSAETIARKKSEAGERKRILARLCVQVGVINEEQTWHCVISAVTRKYGEPSNQVIDNIVAGLLEAHARSDIDNPIAWALAAAGRAKKKGVEFDLPEHYWRSAYRMRERQEELVMEVKGLQAPAPAKGIGDILKGLSK